LKATRTSTWRSTSSAETNGEAREERARALTPQRGVRVGADDPRVLRVTLDEVGLGDRLERFLRLRMFLLLD
jgi:hypothetical protein